MISPQSFIYLRHGETDWNLERRCQGHTDIPLNHTGIAQAEAARDLIGRLEVRIASIVCSPLARAWRTAEIVNQVLGLAITTLEGLKESGFGEREGDFGGQWSLDWQDGVTPPGAEPYADYVQRAITAINTALGHPGPVLIVGHGGVYRSMVRHAGVGLTEDLPNCLPVRHDPPADGGRAWTVAELAPAGRPGAGLSQPSGSLRTS